jgi:glycosyltransferase involved in cell wall biosynthesis
MKKNSILCLVPCYNETKNLPSLFQDVQAIGLENWVDFLFVDDCSRDGTSELVSGAGFRVIRHPVNRGYGGAVKTGLQYGLDHGYSKMVLFPGDHQRSAKDVIRLIEEQNATMSDVVVGSKFHIYSQKYGPIRRRIGNRIFSGMAKFLWGSPIEDVLSGFKIYNLNSVRPLLAFLPDGYPLDIVFSYYASRIGLSIVEIPVDCKYTENTTKMKSVLVVCMKMLLALSKHVVLKPLPKALKKSCTVEKSVSVTG